MSSKVILDEGGSVSVHTRIKDMCKDARNRLGITNQDICDLICEKFGIPDFSVNTVNNFFSERSKATTIYTTGYICSVLGISLDAVFGIEHTFSDEKEAQFIKELTDLKVELRFKEQQLENMERYLTEKEARLSEAKESLDFYRHESIENRKRIQPWVFNVLLVMLILSLGFIAVYLIYFDLGNPYYGLFRSQLAAAAASLRF